MRASAAPSADTSPVRRHRKATAHADTSSPAPTAAPAAAPGCVGAAKVYAYCSASSSVPTAGRPSPYSRRRCSEKSSSSRLRHASTRASSARSDASHGVHDAAISLPTVCHRPSTDRLWWSGRCPCAPCPASCARCCACAAALCGSTTLDRSRTTSQYWGARASSGSGDARSPDEGAAQPPAAEGCVEAVAAASAAAAEAAAGTRARLTPQDSTSAAFDARWSRTRLRRKMRCARPVVVCFACSSQLVRRSAWLRYSSVSRLPAGFSVQLSAGAISTTPRARTEARACSVARLCDALPGTGTTVPPARSMASFSTSWILSRCAARVGRGRRSFLPCRNSASLLRLWIMPWKLTCRGAPRNGASPIISVLGGGGRGV
eukprot:Rhum_TRINITY_DN8877_c0_g1::Rhum_TRINITY_DN8877_c0_g1_i1::g.30417::m.30417